MIDEPKPVESDDAWLFEGPLVMRDLPTDDHDSNQVEVAAFCAL